MLANEIIGDIVIAELHSFESSINVASPTSIEDLFDGITSITLSQEDNNILYAPWKYSFIIKLIGTRITYQYLPIELQQLWKIMDLVPLINLRSDYYILKFTNIQNMNFVLNNGPWFCVWTLSFHPKVDT